MDTDWNNFQVEQIPLATYVKRNLIHLDLLFATLRRSRGAVLEVGVGSGAQSSLLSRLVGRVVSIDNDPRILSVARQNAQRFGPSLRLVRADAFYMPLSDQSFGVGLSQGLMEHFDNESIGLLLREQLRVCRSLVFSVPSDRYPHRDVGDERLMPPEEWQDIIEDVLDPHDYVVKSRYYYSNLEGFKYSVLAGRRLGSFSVLVTIDPLESPRL